MNYYILARSVTTFDGPPWDSKRKKLLDESFEDIPETLVTEIFKIIDDPNYMTGPDVST